LAVLVRGCAGALLYFCAVPDAWCSPARPERPLCPEIYRGCGATVAGMLLPGGVTRDAPARARRAREPDDDPSCG